MLRSLLLIFVVFLFSIFPKNGYSGYRLVTSTGDSGAPGELRNEIASAAPGDTIIIDVAGTLYLTSTLAISKNIVILGPEPIYFTIDASSVPLGPGISLSGVSNVSIHGIKFTGAQNRVIFIGTSTNVSISGCVFVNNFGSGAITNQGSLAVESCSFINNQSGQGGAIYNSGPQAKFANCTFSNNSSSAHGGAIYNSSGFLDLVNNTFHSNTAVGVGDAVQAFSGSVHLRNNIFTPSTTNVLTTNSAIYSTFGGNVFNAPPPSVTTWAPNDLFNTNPLLSPVMVTDGFGLQYYTLQANSPCIDIGGSPTGLFYDQRRSYRTMRNSNIPSFYTDAGSVEYSPYTVNTTVPSGAGSFTQAVTNLVNLALIGNKTIVFEIPVPSTIVQTGVASINKPGVIINGFSQNGSRIPGPEDNAGVLQPAYTPIQFAGAPGFDFLNIPSPSNTVTVAGISIGGFATGIKTDAQGLSVEGCHIGVGQNGTVKNPNIVGIGLRSIGTVANNLIGVENYLWSNPQQARNVISANTNYQVIVSDCGGNKIKGNFIGPSSDGVTIPINSIVGLVGVYLDYTSVSAALSNYVGGYELYDENIVCHQQQGIRVELPNSIVSGNFIGTDYTGFILPLSLSDFANDRGIVVHGGVAIGNYIEGNLISNTMTAGLLLDLNSSRTIVITNAFGVADDYTTPISNNGVGILIQNNSNLNSIGGVDSLDGNLINYSAGAGISYANMTLNSGDSIYGNLIGLDTNFAPAPNGTGIYLGNGTSNILIGDTVPGLGNYIGYNTGAGIGLDALVSNVFISGNSMFLNGDLGIDLDNNGVANITSSLPPVANGAQIPPNLLALTTCGTNNFSTVKIEVDFPVSNNYLIQFFLADSDGQEGDVYIGSTVITPVNQPDTFYFNLPSPALASGDLLVATATNRSNANHHTSEFSDSVAYFISTLLAVNTSGTYCSDIPNGSTATINLVADFGSIVNNGTADSVRWFTDPGMTAQITNPIAFSSATGAVYAGISDGICVMTATVTITVNPSPSLILTSSGVSCNGGSDGSASVIVLGGVPSFSYSWSNLQTTAVATGLAAGTYSVTVTGTGTNVCTSTGSVIITEPPAINLGISTVNILCNGSATGQITTTVSGGVAPYQFGMNGIFVPGTSPYTISGLTAGSYSIEVTDTSGCLSNTLVGTITSPPPLIVTSMSSTNVSCLGADGTIDVIGASGGTPIYSYSIDSGATYQAAASFASLSAGTYSVMLQDQNLCSLSLGLVILNAPIPIAISTDFFTDITCNGLNNGAISSFSATGGLGTFTYQWYNTTSGIIPGETTLNIAGLSAGSFFIQANDSSCTQNSDTVLITDPSPIIMNNSFVNPLCSNTNDGSITIDILTGGTPPFSYTIDGGTNFQPLTLPTVDSFLSAGNYGIAIQDSNNCSSSMEQIILTNPLPVVTSVVVTDISCFGSADGQFEVTMAGGTPGYTISTDGGGTFSTPTGNPEIINASPGNFAINVVTMDANGCTSDTVNYTVIEPAQISYNVSTISDTCSQGVGQIIVSNVTGGTGSLYGYTIDGGSTIQLVNVFTVVGGTYNVIVGDANSCIKPTLNVVVSDTSGVLNLAGASVNDTICPGDFTFIQAYGGASYNWLTNEVADPSLDSIEVSPPTTTVYLVEITSGSCFKIDSTEVVVSADGCALGEVLNNVFSPDADGVNDSFVLDIQYLLTNENTVKIFNRWGDVINEFVNYNNIDVAWDGTNKDGTPVTAGTYFYVVEIPTISYSNSGWIQVVR